MAKKRLTKRVKAKARNDDETPRRADEFAVPQAPGDDEVRHVSVAPCSLELSRDAKGQARWTLKLYGERDQMDGVLSEVLRLDRRLQEEANA